MNNYEMIKKAILEMQVDDIRKQLINYLDELEDRERWLCALEAAGVDNWEGYEYAQEIIEEWNNEE